MSPPSIGRLRELRPAMAGNNKSPSNDTVIFVHGLDTANFKTLRRSLKSWLRHLAEPAGITAAAIYTFSFNLIELILNGREKLLQISEAFNIYIEKLKRRTPDRKFVFLGHGIASFVIQATLARHQSFLIAQSTVAVLFIGLPKLTEDIYWDKYKRNLLQRLSKGSKQHGERSLDFSDIQWTRTNFDLLTSSGASFTVEYFDVPEGHEEMPRRWSFRESISRQGTDSSSGSSNDGKELNSQRLSLPNIQQNDDLHRMCVEGLRKALSLDQISDNSLPPLEPDQTFQQLPPQTPPTQSTNVPHDCLEQSMTRDLKRHRSNLESQPDSRSMSQSPGPGPRLKYESRPQAVVESPAQQKVVEVVELKRQHTGAVIPPGRVLIATRRQELQMLSQLAGDYHYRGNFHQAAQIYQDLILEIEAGNDHSWTITAKCNLAVAWLQQGKIWEAVNKLEELNRTGDEKLPRSHRTTWDIKRWLGIAYDRQGRYQKAYDMLKEQIGRINECMAEPQTSDPSFVEAADILKESSKNAMSLVVCHDGRHTEALLMNGEVLREAENRFAQAKDGPEPREKTLKLRLARIKVNRSLIHVFSGNYKESLALMDTSSKVMEKELGSRHVATLECWWVLAWLLAVLGRIDEAEMQCNKTVDGMTTALGKEHPSTLKALAVRVFIYRMQGRFTTAKTTAKSLVQSNSIILGSIHPQTIHSQDALSSVYIARGELNMALKTQLEVIDLSSSSLREHHPMALAYLCNLATVYGQLQDWDTAEKTVLLLLSKQVELLANKGLNQAAAAGLIAEEDQKPVKSMQDALDLVETMFSGSKNDDLLSPLPPPTLYATIHCLGTVACRNGRGNLSLAARFLTISAKLRYEFFGDQHFDTLTSKMELAVCERHSGNLATSRNALTEIVEIRTEILGENHLDTVYARHELALTKAHLGEVIQAINEMKTTLNIRSMLLGADHPDTIKSQNDLLIISEYFYLQTLYDWIFNLGYQPIDEDYQVPSKGVAELKSMVIKALRATAEAKPDPEMFDHEAYSEQEDLNARLTSQVTASMEALVALYVTYKHFAEAIEMQLLLLAHQESDLGLEDPVTLHSTDVLASIYQAQGTQYLNNLKQLSPTKDLQTLNSLLSEYYNSQVSLAILYSDAGDYETAFTIQAGIMNILKRYELGADLKIMIIGMIDLAWARKALGEVAEARVLLRDADKMNQDLALEERLDFDLDKTLGELDKVTY